MFCKAFLTSCSRYMKLPFTEVKFWPSIGSHRHNVSYSMWKLHPPHLENVSVLACLQSPAQYFSLEREVPWRAHAKPWCIFKEWKAQALLVAPTMKHHIKGLEVNHIKGLEGPEFSCFSGNLHISKKLPDLLETPQNRDPGTLPVAKCNTQKARPA